jgi:hypothetical protein
MYLFLPVSAQCLLGMRMNENLLEDQEVRLPNKIQTPLMAL